MAEALVGAMFISPFLRVLYDRMASPEVVDFFRQHQLKEGVLLEKLKIALLSLNEVHGDAEEKQLTKPVVKRWLDELKDAVYDAEDVLDEIATEALQRKLDVEFQTPASKLRNSISTFFGHFEPKVIDLLETLEFLVCQKDLVDLDLKAVVEGDSSKRLPTTSLVKESGIFGRDDDKEKIISLLLSGDATGNENMCVIPIVGMGGIGKTTLALLVYKDKRVKEHFDLQAWVCVSEEFDVFKLTKTVVEAVTLSTCDMKDLNMLQVALKDKLRGKKFLLVLDDVWNENYADWEVFSSPFKSGALGSRVIVTTRNNSVASTMHALPIDRLKLLREEDCWSLLANYAFHDGNFDGCSELEVIGRQIVIKCEGLPLAAKTIGSLLRLRPGVDEWEKILKSKFWDTAIGKTNILPALTLSYKYLPSPLKQCFAYCSIFPKDYVFKKDEVVLLWMAEGFLEETKNKRMEEVGEDYFLDLAERSFFEQSSGNKSSFVMHDLVNDLAKFVSGQFTLRLEVDYSPKIVNMTRHFSYFPTRFDKFDKFEAIYKASRLRTFLPLYIFSWGNCLAEEVLHNLLPKLRFLRVLSLSHYDNVTTLPESIENIKLLRYLNLSFTAIKRLPDSICNLCNLQTLNLFGCEDLVVLPRNMWKLINLRHLDIVGTGIKEMPMHLGRLKCLQTLAKFFISKHSGASIKELGKLANLRGTLSILELQNVESPMDALKASLKDRKYLEELVLEWNALDGNILERQRSVLDNLQPHCNLKSLTINNSGTESFPDWVGHPSFSNIAYLRLENCKFCCSLPPLGQLPSLQDLSIVGLDGVATVGHEFYGHRSSSTKPFRALKVLRFKNMLKWERWFSFEAENGGGAFPQLKELYILKCPKLTRRLPIHLPSLAKLEINECPQLLASLSNASNVRDMKVFVVAGFNALESLPEGIMNSNNRLQELRIYSCSSLMKLSTVGLPSTLKILKVTFCEKLELPMCTNYPSLERLLLTYSCDSLKSIQLELFPKLYEIKICGCRNLESLTTPGQYESNLVTLEIRDCPYFVSFPKGGLRAPRLTSLCLINCGSLRSLPDKMQMLLPSLQKLHIEDCPEVEPFLEGAMPFYLKSISIDGCDKLNASGTGRGLQKLPSFKHLVSSDKSEDEKSFPKA